MDYLKFNCHDLAVQNNELYEAHGKMQILNEELSDIMGALDMQLKSYEGFKSHFSSIQMAVSEITNRILTTADLLDRIIDVYYSAESRVMQASEELPVKMVQRGNKPSAAPLSQTATASIHNKDLILEDWIAELIYRYDKEENKG